ncbi:MAG: hypothetical protein J7496_16750 [Novosphingobium sp.]|nr:hypothetical protein [Novosphingobium sp.]
MKRAPRLAAALLAGAVGTAPACAQAPGQGNAVQGLGCDRACLIAALDGYMQALGAHSPLAVPAAPDLLFTENDVPLKLGEGLWGTVTEVDKVGLEVADPVTGNAAWFGSVRENGRNAMFAVRIHVDRGRIGEVESVVVRNMDLAGAPIRPAPVLQHDPAFYETLPPEQQRTRPRLQAIADSYFDTVEANDGQVFAPFDEDCGRLENGRSTTSRSDPNGAFGAVALAEGCEAQFKLGIYRINKRIRERRYPIIDTERGIVVASGFFDHANEFDSYKLTDGREMKTALKWPNSISLIEAFRIKDARISRIEAVFTYVPYFMHNPFAGPAASPPDHPPMPAACGEACLAQLAGKTMAAYVSRDWRSLPWADRVGYSDENLGLQVGEGIWGTVTKIDGKPLVIADGRTGKAVWIGRIEEHGQPAWAAVTVTAGEGDRIGDVETLVHRKEYGAPYAEPLAAPAFAELPASRRTDRATMLAAVDAFHGAINRHDGTVAQGIADDCRWAVNGQDVGQCAAPLTGNRLKALAQVRDIELLAVDEARGLVAVRMFEDFPANPLHFTDASGAAYDDPALSPRTLKLVELFRFEGGTLQRIEAYTLQLPYGMRPR